MVPGQMARPVPNHRDVPAQPRPTSGSRSGPRAERENSSSDRFDVSGAGHRRALRHFAFGEFGEALSGPAIALRGGTDLVEIKSVPATISRCLSGMPGVAPMPERSRDSGERAFDRRDNNPTAVPCRLDEFFGMRGGGVERRQIPRTESQLLPGRKRFRRCLRPSRAERWPSKRGFEQAVPGARVYEDAPPAYPISLG